MKKKGLVILLLMAFILTGCNTKTVKVEESKKEEKEVKVENLTFKNILLEYENGITTLTADIIENKKPQGDTLVTIYLKDEEGKNKKELKQIIEKTNDTQVLQVGIVGDYSNIKDVEFKIEDVK